MTARNEAELRAGYASRGIKEAQNRDEAMMLAGELRKSEAYRDPKHPEHAVVKRDIKALYDRFVPNVPESNVLHINGRAISGRTDPQLSRAPGTPADRLIARYNSGDPLSAFSPVDRVQLRRMLVAQPQYRDGKHPDHKVFVEDAKALYAMDTPEGAA